MSTDPQADHAIRLLKTAICPSLSERSKLTYHVGYGTDSDILLRVFANSGKGVFNRDWIPVSAIQTIVNELPEGVAVVSSTFHPLYSGKSSNNSGFLLAVLKHLGLVRSDEAYQRGYEFLDTTEFMAAMEALIAEVPALEASKKTAKAKSQKGSDVTAEVDAT